MSLTAGFEHIIRENEPLAPFTRLKIGGVAEYYAEPTDLTELIQLVTRFSEQDLPIRLIGGGSNLLIRSTGVPGLVLQLNAPAFCTIEKQGEHLVAGGGAQLSHFVASAVREGFSGAEQLVGVPGTVGGALSNNTGALGVDIGSWVESVDLLTRGGQLVTKERDALSFSYQKSSITELVILKACFKFEREPSELLTKRMQKYWIVRRAKQPAWTENATFIFKDYGGDSAADLIEQAGLKGMKVGKVAISEKNSNYFVTEPGATSDEVLRLMELVRNQVQERLGIQLEDAISVW